MFLHVPNIFPIFLGGSDDFPGVDARAGGLWLTISGARSAAGPSRLQQRAKGKGLTLGMAPLAEPVVMHQYRRQ